MQIRGFQSAKILLFIATAHSNEKTRVKEEINVQSITVHCDYLAASFAEQRFPKASAPMLIVKKFK